MEPVPDEDGACPEAAPPDVIDVIDVMDARLCYPDEDPEGRLLAGPVRLTAASGNAVAQMLVDRVVAAEQLVAWARAVQLADLARLAQLPVPPGCAGPLPGGIDLNGYEVAEAEIGSALHMSRRQAGLRLDDAIRLSAPPAIAKLLRTGLIDETRALTVARTMSEYMSGVDPSSHRWTAVEASVARRAPERTAAQLRSDVQRAVLAADPALAQQHHEQVKCGREVRIYSRPDGMAGLEALLTAEAAQIIDTALTLMADAARDAGHTSGQPAATHQQRRADALTGVFSAILDGRPLPHALTHAAGSERRAGGQCSRAVVVGAAATSRAAAAKASSGHHRPGRNPYRTEGSACRVGGVWRHYCRGRTGSRAARG